jgi:hypothetical protein
MCDKTSNNPNVMVNGEYSDNEIDPFTDNHSTQCLQDNSQEISDSRFWAT